MPYKILASSLLFPSGCSSQVKSKKKEVIVLPLNFSQTASVPINMSDCFICCDYITIFTKPKYIAENDRFYEKMSKFLIA